MSAKTLGEPAGRALPGRLPVLLMIGPIAGAGAMSFTLIAALMERTGYDAFWIGLNGAAAALALIGAAALGPRILARISANHLMLAAIVAVALGVTLFPLTSDYALWTLLRLLLGFGSGASFLAVEYWVVAAAAPERRGREVGFYALAVAVGMSSGPALIWFTGVDGVWPFLVCGGLMALSLIGVALAWRSAPPANATPPERGRLLRFFFTDPSLLWAVVFFGAVEAGAFGLMWSWATGVGLAEHEAIGVVVALAAGSLAFQPLIGAAIDRLSPRPLLLAAAASCAIGPLCAAMLSTTPAALYVVMLVWGGVAVGLYSISLATLGGRYAGADLAAANSAIVVGYGVGALLGPISVGAAMSLFGPNGMLWAVGIGATMYFSLVIWRSGTRRA
ncbi:MAG: MFS transporter [Neomegalonema sp.]|nr:MFS transporter [Neomegalonema sp.]